MQALALGRRKDLQVYLPGRPVPLPHISVVARSAQQASPPSPRQVGLAHSDGGGRPGAESVSAPVPPRAEHATRPNGDDRSVVESGSGTYKGGNVLLESWWIVKHEIVERNPGNGPPHVRRCEN